VFSTQRQKSLKSPAKMAIHLLGSPQDYSNLDLPVTNILMSRLISLVVKVAWTEEQLATLTSKIETALQKALR
jgi:8-amino-3,8-dideoxy-alpha-D-manno-octulosonate transaminase